jgi:hypothetical protein
MRLPSHFFPVLWGEFVATPSVPGVKARVRRACVIASNYRFDAFKKRGGHKHVAQKFANQHKGQARPEGQLQPTSQGA